MPKIMLIDAAQPEETRVAVMDGKRLENFDIESLSRKQLKGNVYLAKVTRVEPSLQAAFVNYGGNRHGFLPFSEIHPDYYRIPIADRERLLAEQEELRRQMQEEAEAREEAELAEAEARALAGDDAEDEESVTVIEPETGADDDAEEAPAEESDDDAEEDNIDDDAEEAEDDDEDDDADDEEDDDDAEEASAEGEEEASEDGDDKRRRGRGGRRGRGRRRGRAASRRDAQIVDHEGEDEVDSGQLWKRMRKSYKIQEVIKRGQIMLIQVVKEERGNKGAAVTSYITMPGRYCVLMPNSPQSGGVSRKVASHQDRRKMRDMLTDLSVPDGMSVILRTAGVGRTKVEVKRDLDYLMRLWDMIRDTTMKSTAPALIHEEGSLVKRAIRDHYAKDIDEILVEGEEGVKVAKDVMKMMMPSHVRRVKQYKDTVPLFIKYGAEPQIDAIHSNTVTLKSGGYLVINPTEALVSIDINSGRATRERHIEETALKTNLEAADEIARQLRLRDLGGLIVIDFIDMESRRNNAQVERRMRDALSNDRARVQMGRISTFGLMELSRQRLRPSLTETHFQTCPHCQGLGMVRTTEATALAVLRAIETACMEGRAGEIQVTVTEDVGMFLFNVKRASVALLEERYGVVITLALAHIVDNSEGFEIDINKTRRAERLPAIDAVVDPDLSDDDEDEEDETDEDTAEESDSEESDDQDGGRRRGRRRGRRGGRNRNRGRRNDGDGDADGNVAEGDDDIDDNIGNRKSEDEGDADGNKSPEKSDKRGRSRGRRGGRGRRRSPSGGEDGGESSSGDGESERAAPRREAPAAQAVPQSREYEIVNEVSGDKKKGWWKKLTG